MNPHQLMVLRTLISSGWPSELLSHLLDRCGCSEQDWAELVNRDYVENRNGKRWHETSMGLTEYRRQSKGKWF